MLFKGEDPCKGQLLDFLQCLLEICKCLRLEIDGSTSLSGFQCVQFQPIEMLLYNLANQLLSLFNLCGLVPPYHASMLRVLHH